MLNTSTKNFLSSLTEINIQNKFNINESFYDEDIYKYANFRIIQEISYKCSANCPYCMNKGLDYSQEELPVEEYINFYKKLIANGATITDFRITGGEPTQPNVIERTNKLVEYALNEPAIKILQINTNGYWDIPIEWNHEKVIIQFSLDGDEKRMIENTGYQDIYKRLMKNIDFCEINNIQFQFRSVVSKMEDIYLLAPIYKKYNKFAIISMATPVGGAKNLYNKQEYIDMILSQKEYEKFLQKENIYGDVRLPVGYCEQSMIPGYISFMITPSGQIGNCPFLATKYLTDINILNFDFDNISVLRKIFKDQLKDSTCYFPQGFLNFWKTLTKKEKQLLETYINQNRFGMPTIKEFYGEYLND